MICGTSAVAAPQDSAKGSFLLIDGGAPAGQPRLTGCDRATSDLHAALDQAGTPNTVLIAPAAGTLREALLRFGNDNGGRNNAVLFCGYAVEAGGNVFALGNDFTTHDDPALTAVSIRAFSRVTGDKDGLVLLNLHPVAADGAPVAAVAGALDGAAGAWSSDTGLSGTRIAVTDKQPADATLIEKAAHAGASTPDTLARALTQPAAAPAPLPAPAPVPGPAPAAQAEATPAVPPPVSAPAPTDAKTPVADNADPGTAKTTNGPASGAPPANGSAPPPATGADGTAIPLAPKPAPPRPRVHVDPAVRRIQVALLARGLFTGRVNGVNSPETQNGVRHFQAMLGHPATGQLTADETKQLTGG